jgi:hypothetical protein
MPNFIKNLFHLCRNHAFVEQKYFSFDGGGRGTYNHFVCRKCGKEWNDSKKPFKFSI